jgi:hypothetical protein
MSQFVIGGAIGAFIVGTIGGPFLLPWSLRVRFLVNAPMIDPFLGLGPEPCLDMHAVRLTAVEIHHGDVEVAFDEMGAGRTSVMTCAGAGCPPAAVAQLDGWMALRTTLLVTMDHGHVDVYGPGGGVAGLSLSASREQKN